jgi:lipase chaperone LimK
LKDKRKIIIAISVIAVLIAFNYICRSSKTSDGGTYLQDKNDLISFKEASDSFKKVKFDDPSSAREYFSKNAVNQHTVRFFKFLQSKFKDSTLEEHLEAVRSYLYTIMSRDDADQLFAIYKKYISYETDLNAKMKNWKYPTNIDEALDYMNRIRDFRRETFGPEISDKMFSAEFKMREYHVRRKSLISDNSLYAKDKEEKLKKLNNDMWGDGNDDAGDSGRPFDRYQEKLQMYSKDMSELTPDKKSEMDKSFREEIFPPDVVKKFEDIDIMLEEERKTESAYRDKELKIMNDINLTPDQKQEQITQLQNQTFGEEAEAFRRREAIRTAEHSYKK